MKLYGKSSVIFAFAFILLSAQAIAQSDESGTLVMAARTTSGVVIAIDSAITYENQSHIQSVSIDGDRKLIDIGRSGACAIEGFTGNVRGGNDIAQEARIWLRANPKASGFEALTGILNVAVKSWDSEHYIRSFLGTFPGDRFVGADITHIMCGEIFDDGPGIIEANTTVAADGSAKPSRLLRIVGSFECLGYCDWPTLVGLIQNTDSPATATLDFQKVYPKVREDILSDPLAVKSLQAFIVEQKRTTKIYQNSGGKPVFPQSKLTQAQVKTLFTTFFESVERNTDGVAPPNNVRLITKCGRFSSTVGGTWRTCGR
jgi:hypothetical protein